MIRNKYIDRVAALLMAAALLLTLYLTFRQDTDEASSQTVSTSSAEYEEKVFGSDIFSLEILADESTWQTMLENASSEEYISVDVVVNGTKFYNVGIRPKGNSSLSQVSGYDSQRYSFRLKFDQYVEGQTCFGLDSFVVNNMIGDSTYMKEYVSYRLMEAAGVESPCISFANLSVNGENWGLYLAVELYDESFEARVYGDTEGMLYNVKSMDVGGGNGGEMPGQMPQGAPPQRPTQETSTQETSTQETNGTTGASDTAEASETSVQTQPQTQTQSQSGTTQSQTQAGDSKSMAQDVKMSPGRGSSGGDLVYTDDNVSSYSAIFDNVVGKGSDEDYQRVIQALEALSKGEDLETYFDVDQILRYLAVHTLVVNLDSYSSSMAQNYYLYERDGRVTVLPWDYNLAWGGFQSSDASSVINFPIDTPVSGVELSERPLIAVLLSNSEYLERYHTYLQEILDGCFANGAWESMISEINSTISSYVEQDSTAFCTFEQYQEAVSAFRSLGLLRAQSVQGQLDGTIPSTTEGQKQNPDALVQSDGVSLAAMGTMQGGHPGQGGEKSETSQEQNRDSAAPAGNFTPPEQGGGPMGGNGPMPNAAESTTISVRSLLWIGIPLVVLAAASIVAIRMKRRY